MVVRASSSWSLYQKPAENSDVRRFGIAVLVPFRLLLLQRELSEFQRNASENAFCVVLTFPDAVVVGKAQVRMLDIVRIQSLVSVV